MAKRLTQTQILRRGACPERSRRDPQNNSRLLVRYTLLAALLTLSTAPALAGALYKWIDAEGKVHYTDAPPAQGKVLNRQDTAASSATGDENYCATIQRVAQVVAQAMQQGTPAEEINAALRSTDSVTQEKLNVDAAVLQQIVGYIYGFKYSRSSASVIASNVHSRCLNGVYAAPRKPKPPAADTPPESPPETP